MVWGEEVTIHLLLLSALIENSRWGADKEIRYAKNLNRGRGGTRELRECRRLCLDKYEYI